MALPLFFLPHYDDSDDRRPGLSRESLSRAVSSSADDAQCVAEIRLGSDARYSTLFLEYRTSLREFALTFADGTAMLHHSLVKWFIDGWRGALGDEHEASSIFDDGGDHGNGRLGGHGATPNT